MDVKESKLANEIVSLGLKKAAESMAFFTKEEVKIEASEVKREPIDHIYEIVDFNSADLHYVLSTEIKGELAGVCYLIFSEEEVQRILEVVLPEGVRSDSEKLRVMGDAVLLEMDNIIVASVITQFSNSFSFKMYGDVPQLEKSSGEDLKKKLTAEKHRGEYFIYFKSKMHTEKLDISPDFLWVLEDNFIKGVQKVIAASQQ